MADNSEKYAIPVAVKLLPDDWIDVQVLDKKPAWAKKKNTSHIIFPELGVSAVVYWKPKKLPPESSKREQINQMVGRALIDAISGPDPRYFPMDKDGNRLPAFVPFDWLL